jgi:hypothetical protein
MQCVAEHRVVVKYVLLSNVLLLKVLLLNVEWLLFIKGRVKHEASFLLQSSNLKKGKTACTMLGCKNNKNFIVPTISECC